MNTTTLAHERNKATGQLMFLVFFAVVGSVIMAAGMLGWKRFDFSFFQFASFVTFGFVLIVTTGGPASFVLDTLRITGDDDSPLQAEANNSGDASDILTDWMSEHRPRNAIIVSNEEGTGYKKCRYNFQQAEWRRLVRAMQSYAKITTARHWVFSRDHTVRKADIFTDEITPGTSPTRDWNQILIEFQRLNIIRKRGGSWVVTDAGMWTLTQAAGFDVISLHGEDG